MRGEASADDDTAVAESMVGGVDVRSRAGTVAAGAGADGAAAELVMGHAVVVGVSGYGGRAFAVNARMDSVLRSKGAPEACMGVGSLGPMPPIRESGTPTTSRTGVPSHSPMVTGASRGEVVEAAPDDTPYCMSEHAPKPAAGCGRTEAECRLQ